MLLNAGKQGVKDLDLLALGKNTQSLGKVIKIGLGEAISKQTISNIYIYIEWKGQVLYNNFIAIYKDIKV